MVKEIRTSNERLARLNYVRRARDNWSETRTSIKLFGAIMVAGVAVGFGSLKAHPSNDGIHTDYDNKMYYTQAIAAAEKIEPENSELEAHIDGLSNLRDEIKPREIWLENVQAKAATGGMILGFSSAILSGAVYAGIRMRDRMVVKKNKETLDVIQEIKQEKELPRPGKMF